MRPAVEGALVTKRHLSRGLLMNPTRTKFVATAIAAITILAACGGSPNSANRTGGRSDASPAGDIPDTQVFVPYSSASQMFSVTVPEGWARTDLGNGAEFTDKLNHVRIEQSTVAVAPTVASTKSDLIPRLRQSEPGFSGGRVSAVTRTSGPATLIQYSATGAADATTGKATALAVERYEYWKDGQLVALTLSGPRGADNVDPWRTITDSFRWSR